MTLSCLYEGTVRHRRFGEHAREFSYPLSMPYLVLDEVSDLLDGRLVARGPGLARWRRRDYHGDPSRPLEAAVRDTVAAATGWRPEGRVALLAQPRVLGLCFNPIALYYCFDEAAEGTGPLRAVAAEVTNTPWGERHAYVLGAPAGAPVASGTDVKALHVSPFMGMDQRYRWRVAVPGETLSVHIESAGPGGELTFDATLSLRRRPLTRASLAAGVLRHGGPAAVVARIYAQALRLRLRGAPVHPHPRTVG